MFELTITELAPLGDFDATYGLRYWGRALDDDKPISFNSMDKELATKLIHAGTLSVVCETKTLKKSAKGTLYWQLKKVKPLETHTSPVEPSESQASAPHAPSHETAVNGSNEVLERLKSIEGKLDRLLGLDEMTPEQPRLDKVADVNEDEEINLDDIPFN